MRLLWLLRFPYGRPTGGAIRAQQLIRGALEAGHEVTVVDVAATRSSSAPEAGLRIESFSSARPPAWLEAPAYLASGLPSTAWASTSAQGVRTYVEQMSLRHDAIVVGQTDCWPLLPTGWRGPVIVDMQNVESELFTSLAEHARSWPSTLRYRLDSRRARRLERTLADRAERIWVCSTSDHEFFSSFTSAGRLVLVPNGAPSVPHVARQRVAGRVLMVASWNHPPNHDGAQWFVHEVWPRVLHQRPDARLHLVGLESRYIAHLHAHGVSVVGEVADLAEHYSEATVCIAPLRFGGGTKLKVLEALAYARPVVGTPESVRGLHAPVPVLTSSDATSFALHVLRCLDDELFATALADEGIQWVERHYSWTAVRAVVARELGSMS